jgi:hypothetical protein
MILMQSEFNKDFLLTFSLTRILFLRQWLIAEYESRSHPSNIPLFSNLESRKTYGDSVFDIKYVLHLSLTFIRNIFSPINI